jgi:tetratricopeptide (TPR) repeat protein
MRRTPLLLCSLLLALHARGEAPPSPRIIERYKQMLAANPAEGIALDRLWKMYLDQGKAADLIEEYRSGGTFAREMVLGHLLHKAGQSENAAAAFQRAAKLDEKNPLPLLALGRLEDSDGHGKAAAEWYEKAAGLLSPDDPRMPDTLLLLGSAWLSSGDAVKAAGAWERVTALRPEDLDLRRRLADAYERNLLPARAIAHLEYIVEHAPPAERAPALQRLALIHQGAGHRDAAIAALEKALALTSPGNWLRPELESQLIRLHQRYHRTAELEQRWKKFAAENPRDLGACLQLVELYERLGDLENQRTWLTTLTQLAPKNAEYKWKLARLLTQMDAPETAAAIYDELLKEQPANADFVFERAKIDMLRDAAPAARQRIAALLTAKHNDEALGARALEFYEHYRLTDLVEARLAADAAGGSEDAISALANFYFSQHREAEAQRALDHMIHPGEPPAQQAAARAQIAQIFKGQNDLEKAVGEMKEALRLQPEARDYHLGLGELYAARGEYPAAQGEFATVERLSKTPQEKTQADQKLFECFHSQAAAAAAASGRGRSSLPFPATGMDGLPEPDPALEEYLAKMEEDAAREGTEDGWLRLARWRLWNHDLKGSLAAVNSVLEINPKSTAAYELLVNLNATNGPSPRAVQDLQKLAELDPANRAGYQRRAGQLELQAGHILEALDIFQNLASASPGNLDALTDLALTQQRAERWNEALATWRQIYVLSPASRKKDAMGPLLRAYEKLELHSQAAALQLSALDAAANDRERFAIFGDLLAYCSRHNLLDWLRAEFEKRRQLRADDYFTEVALARILKASGDPSGAFELFADASYAAPNQAEALPDLIHEAEDLHKLDSAAKLQAQFVRIAPQESPDSLEKLAELQEKNFQIEDAARTWDRVAAKFPRDATALGHAVEFQLAWGATPRAIALLRKARSLEPSNLQTLSTLAGLDIDAGETAEAEACLDQILRETTPEKAGDPVRFPAMQPTDAGRLQTAYLATVEQRNGHPSTEAMRALRNFWVDESPDQKSDRDFRLNAIRERAQLFQAGSPARAAWIEQWRRDKDKPSEALWALYYAGAGEAALDRVDAMLSGDSDGPGGVGGASRLDPVEAMLSATMHNAQASQAFVWLALQTRQYVRLRAWLQDRHRTPTERDYVFIALGQLLDANGENVDPGLLDTLFAEGTHLRLWQAAMVFANRNRLREAARLGQRVFDQSSSQRAAFGDELAHWYVLLGAPDRARAILKTAIQSSAESFEAPVCAALRDYYLLLPEGKRAAFVESYLAGIDKEREPIHAVIAATLLHGLSGDEKAAKEDLSRLLDMRVLASIEIDDESATATMRRWRFLLNAGNQLQAWNLDNLSIDLWEKALADDALVQLEGEPIVNAARDLRQRLCVLHASAAPIGELQKWMDAFARVAPHDGAAPLAEGLAAGLATMGANTQAIEVYRRLWEHDHSDPEILRKLLATCRAAGDDDTAEAMLASTFTDANLPLNDGVRREFIVQFVDLLERRGEIERARALLAESLETAPGDTRLLQRLGNLNEKAGRTEQAATVYQQLLSIEPGNVPISLALSAILEKQGRISDALALVEKSSAPELEGRLAVLQIRNHHPEEALAALDRIPPPQHITPVIQAVDAFVEARDFGHARIAIHAALNRTADSRMNFPLECKLIELLTPEDGQAAAQREMRRLRKFTGSGVGLLGSYLDFASRQSARLNLAKEFAKELEALWADGKGPAPAGIALLNAELQAGDKAAAIATTERLLAREDVSDAWLQMAADALEKAQLTEWLARVEERMAQINPINEQNSLLLARTLRQLGRKEAARSTLNMLALRATLSDDTPARRTGLSDELAAKVAGGFIEAGDLERARALFAQAMRGDPFARNYPTLLQYAQLQTRMGDEEAAKKTLRVAFANPANHTFNAIIDWMVATGHLDRFETEAIDFGLTSARVTELRRAIFAYFEKAGQVVNACALVEAHPEILRSEMIGSLRSMAGKNRDFASVAQILEKLAAQGVAEASTGLAQLYGDWGQAEASDHPDAALAHLRKAHELRPELPDVALRLSALQMDQGDRRSAMETLESFLAVAKNPAEIEKARAQLAKLKTGS